ncbi:MAG: hypothetical protein ABI162_12680 [Luteolibacter sp.]
MSSSVMAPLEPTTQHVGCFPSDQVFLWLPESEGEESAYCSGNNVLPKAAEVNPSEAPFTSISLKRFGSHIRWQMGFSPSSPYHPVPVAHSLSADEMKMLSVKVIELLDDPDENPTNPLAILRNDRKSFILAALAKLGLLPQPSAPLSASSSCLAAT